MALDTSGARHVKLVDQNGNDITSNNPAPFQLFGSIVELADENNVGEIIADGESYVILNNGTRMSSNKLRGAISWGGSITDWRVENWDQNASGNDISNRKDVTESGQRGNFEFDVFGNYARLAVRNQSGGDATLDRYSIINA